MSIFVDSQKRRAEDSKKLSLDHKSLDAELYGLGHTMKHLQPPGGTESGVFDAFKFQSEVPTPNRKIKDYYKSHIFDKGEQLPSRPSTPDEHSTKNRLFPESPSSFKNPTHNNFKSTVFEPDHPNKPPMKLVKKNPITGEFCQSADCSKSVKSRNIRNPITFEGVTGKSVPSRCTQPPGGKCTFKLEYIE